MAEDPIWEQATAADLAGVHVWRVPLGGTGRALPRLQTALSADERERAARFSLEKPRTAYTLARGSLRLLLGRYLNRDPAALRFVYGEHGKPALEDGALHFNLSHSGDLALVALAADRPVGVDIEFRRDRVSSDAIARRFFAADEVEALQALGESRRKEAFFRVWTRKEAYLKALGAGITVALDSFSVNIDPEAALRRPPDAAATWRLRHLDPGPGYTGAVCAPGQWTLSCRQWNPDF